MIKIELTTAGLSINGKLFSFPIRKEDLFDLFGEPVLFVSEYNEAYIWHDLGLKAYAEDGVNIQTLEVTYQVQDYSNAVRSVYTGDLSMNGELNPMVYYQGNRKDRIKLWDSDTSGAFVFKDITAWYSIRNDVFLTLCLQAFKPTVEEVNTLALEEKYMYLEELWNSWKEAIENRVGKDNKYYNPRCGINQEQLDTLNTQLDPVALPELFINFYKAGNVNWNAVTSAIQFEVNGWSYDLLPFDMISGAWESIMELNEMDEELDVALKDSFDAKVKCDFYANRNWIPFAEGKNGDYLVVDTDPSKLGMYGQIVEIQNESWERTVVANSLEELIHREIALLKGESIPSYQFIIENGTF